MACGFAQGHHAPGSLARLGLAPEALLERYPSLVLTSISDFGQTGPYRDWVATDATMNAIGGMQWKAGMPEKPPLLPPGAIAYVDFLARGRTPQLITLSGPTMGTYYQVKLPAGGR